MRKQRRTKLSTKISALTVLSSACALLVLGMALIIMFTLSLSEKTEADISFYLDNTNQQFADKIQFVQDSAITIRHNTILRGFFSQRQYDENEVETQLVYCMDLFSDRNQVDQATPFVTNVYLFNNMGSFVRSRYYPSTLAALEQKDQDYKLLWESFAASSAQFQWYPEETQLHLCFRIYNDEMKQMGIGIVTVEKAAVDAVFASVQEYQNHAWIVMAGDALLSGEGQDGIISWLQQRQEEELQLNGKKMLCSVTSNGFGLQTMITVSRNNIYTDLMPTVWAFILVLSLVLTLVSVILLGVTYRSVRPLKEMAAEIAAFGQDNLSVRMRDSSVQEFHDISATFNEMADRIDYLITETYEKELLATSAQVKYLQAQINPHFQFNILAMFSIKAKLAGNDALYQSLQAFSKLIQGKIFREKEIKIPLSSEMELVDFYLFLQKERYQEKLTYEICYGSEAVKTCLIPKLLIEPLVENAVSHGIEPKSENGKVTVNIFEQDGQLHIIVSDDGVGFDANELTQPPEKSGHTSTGLANTKRLLQILYHEKHEIKIKGIKGQGTTVEVILPVERRSSDVQDNGGRR